MEEARARGSVRRTASRTMSRNRSTAWRMEDVFSSSRGGSYNRRSSRHSEEDEEALRWAALEKLPTYDRLRTTIMKSYMNDDDENQRAGFKNNVMHKEIDVRKLDPNDKQQFIDRIFKVAEEDNEKFLIKFRNRIDKVGITLPTVEVRFERLTIEADCHIGDRALPSLANTARNLFELALGCVGISLAEKTKLTILKDVSGIIKPSRH